MENQAKVGGILCIVSGAFCVFHLAWTAFTIYMVEFMFDRPFSPNFPTHPFPPDFYTFMTIFYGAIGLFFTLSGILAIVGGVFALKKRRWGMALAGSVAGTFTFFPVGIPAIIFIAMAKQEFSTPKALDSVS